MYGIHLIFPCNEIAPNFQSYGPPSNLCLSLYCDNVDGMNERKIARISFSILSILSWAAFAWLIMIMTALVSLGNEPRASDDATGLASLFGFAAGLISVVPLVLAIIFTVCTILALRKSKS